jgi:multidrug efflux pump subunit AcrB
LKTAKAACVRDAAQVRDGYAPQTNMVRSDGKRAARREVGKTGSTSAIAVARRTRRQWQV